MAHPFLRLRRGAVLVAAALAGAAAQAALPVFVDATTGALVVGNGAPGDWRVRIEVGPTAGAVRVVDQLAGRSFVFGGITRIDARTGAGSEILEFDIAASQSLALNVDTGSGDAQLKLQWRVPRGAAATQSTLALASGAGRVETELDFESETPNSGFAWTTAMGGGDKTIKAALRFAPGTVAATQNLDLRQLGGGRHRIELATDSRASRATLRLDGGFAQEVAWKVASPDPSARLAVAATTRAVNSAVEVLSAASATAVTLAGGVANVADAGVKLDVAQTVPGTLSGRIDLAPSLARTKVEAKFDGTSGSTLALAGRLRTGGSADLVKIETNLPTTSALEIQSGGGDDLVELLVGGPLAAPATGLPRLAGGDGNDQLRLLAAPGSSAVPAIACGLGRDSAQASVGTPSGCELFSR